MLGLRVPLIFALAQSALPAPTDDSPAPVAGELDRTQTYESLYANHAYHSNPKISHAKAIIPQLVAKHFASAEARARARVLDVGCSHGLGVSLLWKLGMHASGTDLAPTAVAMATRLRHPGPPPTSAPFWPCLRDRCFKVGSAAALPWANASFDAILSTDVLEHIPPALVPQVVAEFSRVARGSLFLAIALEAAWEESEAGRRYCAKKAGTPIIVKGKAHYICHATMLGAASKRAAPIVHETVQTAAWWIAQLEKGPWRCAQAKSEHADEKTAWLKCERAGSRR